MKNVIIPTIRTSLLGAIALAALIMLPAWTLSYWQGWVFVAVFVVSTNAIGVYLVLYDPELLERRKKVGPGAESTPAQKIIVTLLVAACLAVLVFSSLDHRFSWSRVPAGVSLAGDVLVALGLLVDFWVLRENRYGSSTIQTVEGQKVITTGLYALVRHPMYSGVMVMFAGVPLALGSYWGLLIVLAILPVLLWRIFDEETFLAANLPGYADYCAKFRWRLLPGVF